MSLRPSSPLRRDVCAMLLRRGWRLTKSDAAVEKNGITFASIGRRRDSVLRLAEAHPDHAIEFSEVIPARVIVATCEAAAA